MPIEFDAARRAATFEARGLDMARAGEAFAGATLTVEDDRRDYGEDPLHHRGVSRRRNGGPGLDAARRRAPDHQHEESQ